MSISITVKKVNRGWIASVCSAKEDIAGLHAFSTAKEAREFVTGAIKDKAPASPTVPAPTAADPVPLPVDPANQPE